ncbi:hypothetical protein NW761_011254 [Fusarium oxysporum]|nr:hypothetical protein NW753_004912 [Fusarium oxysporum]KAJ4064061.1 hypothetical protein NW763_004338 [Fusarium oxysporum]KAJ4077139.1 hypothetical protein NW756_012628 [Fusarium oxysporum]KAJ4079846.1 hypothetical protein NW761_011254 [Fusarium oxysporum]KAJ4118998.1 hypothetical protein NW769_001599 [Fusarium oxysporum]
MKRRATSIQSKQVMNAIKKRESLSSDMIPMQDGNQIISRITMKADTPSYRSQQISTSCKIIRIRYVLLWLKGSVLQTEFNKARLHGHRPKCKTKIDMSVGWKD